MNIEIVREILASDIINWMFAALGGSLAYIVLHRMQNSRERHMMIKDIEDSMTAIMDMPLAKKKNKDKQESLQTVNFRTVLHDDTPWILFNKKNNQLIKGQRYILVRDDEICNEFIGTALIHESLLWFRRVNKLYNDKIVKDEDLADLWRQILPFMRANKLAFYRSYLGEDDTYPMLAVCIHCIKACYSLKRSNAIIYIKDMIDETDDFDKYLNELHSKWIIKRSILRHKLNIK